MSRREPRYEPGTYGVSSDTGSFAYREARETALNRAYDAGECPKILARRLENSGGRGNVNLRQPIGDIVDLFRGGCLAVQRGRINTDDVDI